MKKLWLVYVMAIFFVNEALAQVQSISEDALMSREKTAARQNSDMNHLDRSYAYYLRVRDHYFYGPTGIDSLGNYFFKESLHWIDNWSKFLDLLDISQIDTIDQVLNLSASTFDKQRVGLQDLVRTASNISSKGDAALGLLAEAKTITIPEEEQYRDIFVASLRQIADLENTIRSVASLAESKVEELRRINHLSHQVSMNRLKSELVKTSRFSLDQSIARFGDLLETERATGELITSLENGENELDNFVLNMAYFQAKDAFLKVDFNCQLAKEKVANLESRFARNALQRIDQLCTSAASHWQSMQGFGLSEAELVFEYVAFLQSSLAKECRKNSPRINCEKFALLESVRLNQVQKMSEDQLRFFEMQWADLEKMLSPTIESL